ncbi:hypothetical protein LCGC14_2566720 [marine sediment metagenome]|uniref:Uncharacterized protein n=1 Tax=marine sediment metagenome TaxID=412755 RepID=A0A0F9DBC5_9ZZZZ
MLHRIPLGGAAREMAHRDLQVKSVRDSLLEPFLEMPGTIAVAATGVGQDEQFVTLSVVFPSVSKPPLSDGIDGKLWRVGRDADMDESVITTHIVHPIWSHLAQGILREIVCIHFDWLLGPGSTRVLGIANELLVFRVHADHG